MTLPERIHRAEPDLALCACLAFALVALAFVLESHIGFNMQDESFLWYGVVRTHAGELPMRDFRAYDPGRYLWCAAWATIFGDGLVAVRAASAIFAALGLTCGLLAARRVIQDRWLLVPIGFLLLMWMSPPWKLFESSLAMIAVFTAVKWIEAPTRARHVVAGIVVGIAAFFGRNMGLYVGLAFGSLTLYLAWKERARDVLARIGSLAVGVVLGYAPMLALIVFAKDFGAAFVASIRFYAQQNTLNAELPLPWPWRYDYSDKSLLMAAWGFLVGVLFLLLPLVYVGALVPILRARREDLRRRALLVGAVFVGAFWAHHASVRGDLHHLAQSIHPLLLALIALPSVLGWKHARTASFVLVAVLLAVGFLTIGFGSPIARKLTAGPRNEYVPVQVGADTISMARSEARSVEALMQLMTTHVKPAEKLWVGSPFIGLYLLMGRRSPAWEIYPAWKANESLQQRLLGELSDVDWVLMDTRPISGDENMQLSRSHPLVWQMLMHDFERIPVAGAPDTLLLLKRKRA
jgi:hypothetical protein